MNAASGLGVARHVHLPAPQVNKDQARTVYRATYQNFWKSRVRVPEPASDQIEPGFEPLKASDRDLSSNLVKTRTSAVASTVQIQPPQPNTPLCPEGERRRDEAKDEDDWEAQRGVAFQATEVRPGTVSQPRGFDVVVVSRRRACPPATSQFESSSPRVAAGGRRSGHVARHRRGGPSRWAAH